MKTVALFKASSDREDYRKQKQAIHAFAQNRQISISRFIEIPIPSQTTEERKIDLLLGQLNAFDTLIVSSLGQISSSVAQIITTVNTLLKNGVRLVAISEGIDLNTNNPDSVSEAMIRMFSILAEIEHKQVATKEEETFLVPKARGRNGGRPTTDPKKLEQARILYENSNQTAAEICKAVGIGRSTFFSYLSKSRAPI